MFVTKSRAAIACYGELEASVARLLRRAIIVAERTQSRTLLRSKDEKDCSGINPFLSGRDLALQAFLLSIHTVVFSIWL